jgi:hypothetical protein
MLEYCIVLRAAYLYLPAEKLSEKKKKMALGD